MNKLGLFTRTLLVLVIWVVAETFFSGSFLATPSFATTRNVTWSELKLDEKFDRLISNYAQDVKMEDSLYVAMSEAEWTALYRRRINLYKQIRHEDDSIINSIYDYFKYSKSIANYKYEELLTHTTNFYRKTIDAFITEHFASLVLPHFKNINDGEHLYHSNAIVGLALTQIASEGEQSDFLNALNYLRDAADYAHEHFMEMKSYDSFDYLIRIYQELLHVRWLQQRKQTLAETYLRYLEIQDVYLWLVKNPDPSIDAKIRERISQVYFDYEYNMLGYIISDQSPYTNSPEIKLLTKFVKKHHELKTRLWNEKHKFEFFIKPLFEVQYNYVKCVMNLNTPLQSFLAIDSIYQSIKGQPDLKSYLVEIIGYINDAVTLLDKTEELDYSAKQQYATSYLKDLMWFAKFGRMMRRQSTFYDRLENLVTNQHFYKYLTDDSRHDMIQNVLAKTDAEAYAHSTLVAWIGWNIMDKAIKDKPELLIGSLGYTSEAQVQKNQKELHEFFWNACLSHDLGLNRMTPVINRHARSLTSHEFQLLRRHASNGASIIKISPINIRYYDMILGHHKWYNGLGYPESFDNIHSPHSMLIDMLSISDYLEGGADVPGDGGITGSFDERLHNLQEFAGTQFNPRVVNMILEDSDLIYRLRDLCENGQMSVRYKVYNEYVNVTKQNQ